jgi:hypothetical protein
MKNAIKETETRIAFKIIKTILSSEIYFCLPSLQPPLIRPI